MSTLNYDVNQETIVASGSAVTLTTSWADLGSEIQMHGFNSLGIWVTLDINSSNNARIRALVKLTSAATNEYQLPIKTVGSTSVGIEAEVFEFTSDADGNFFFDIDTRGHVGFIQLQGQVGTVGATGADIDELIVTKRYDA